MYHAGAFIVWGELPEVDERKLGEFRIQKKNGNRFHLNERYYVPCVLYIILVSST